MDVKGKHYEHGALEPIDVIDAWGLGFSEGCIVKYVARWRHKDGLKDLYKAKWYLNHLINLAGNRYAPAVQPNVGTSIVDKLKLPYREAYAIARMFYWQNTSNRGHLQDALGSVDQLIAEVESQRAVRPIRRDANGVENRETYDPAVYTPVEGVGLVRRDALGDRKNCGRFDAV